MSDYAKQIEDAQKEAASLKEKLKAAQAGKSNTTLKDASASTSAAPKLAVRARRTLKGHLAKVYSLQWADDKVHIVSASQDGKLLVWDAVTTNKVHAIPLRSSWVMTCSFSPSGSLVACGGLDNICSVFNLRSPAKEGGGTSSRPCRELSAHTGYLSCCKFIDDKQIITSSGDMTAMIWDVETGQEVKQFFGHNGDVMSIGIKYSENNNTFITGACDSTAKLWDIRSGKLALTFRGHTSDVNGVCFFPNGKSFGTGSDDSSARLWDIRAGLEVQKYHQEGVTPITSIDFSKSGKFLVAGYDDSKVHVWDTLKAESNLCINAHDQRVSCLGMSSDGTALATGSWDAQLKIWA